ncbi:MAG: PilZ domain-containing protein [Perlucidibaca sp.]
MSDIDRAMTESPGGSEELASAICLEGVLPVAWKDMPAGMGDVEYASLHEGNLMLLNAIAVMEQPRHADSEESQAIHQELFRLEAKLDLLTSLMTRLLEKYELVPPLASVRLTARSFHWHGSMLPAEAGRSGIIEIYVHPLVAAPLRLPARVEQAGSAQLAEMPVVMRNALERFLFRQHRRQVAEHRQTRV